MDIARDPAAKGRLLVRYAGPVPSGARIKVAAGEGAFLLRDGMVVASLKVGGTQVGPARLGPGARPVPPGAPMDCELWFVSTVPTGGLPVMGSFEVIEGNATLRIGFNGTCGMACTDPAKFVTKLLQANLPLEDAFHRVLLCEHVIDALRSTVQASLDASTMTVPYLRADEPTKLILDYALMAGRQLLMPFGMSFLGFDAGRFDVPRDAEKQVAASVAPALPLVPPKHVTGNERTVLAEVTPVPLQNPRPAQPRRPEIDPLAMTPGSGLPQYGDGASGSLPMSEPVSSAQIAQPHVPSMSAGGKRADYGQTPYPISREAERKVPIVQRQNYAGTAVAVLHDAPFPPGTRVRAQASDGKWYPGIVSRIDAVGKLEIRFDDGGAPEWLDARRVTHG